MSESRHVNLWLHIEWMDEEGEPVVGPFNEPCKLEGELTQDWQLERALKKYAGLSTRLGSFSDDEIDQIVTEFEVWRGEAE
jgi:hypothetical protein